MAEHLDIRGIHSVEVAGRFVTEWLDYLTKGFGFQYIGKSTADYENRVGYRTHTLKCADTRIVLLESVNENSPVANFLRKHPEGISHVNYWVRSISQSESFLEKRGAALIDNIQEEQAIAGVFRHFSIATPLGDVNYRFCEIEGEADIVPGQERIAAYDAAFNPLGIIELDHLTSNVRTLQPLISWYEQVLGFSRFWDVEFHTEDLKSGHGTGLKSIVVWDAHGKKVKLANNEPLRPRFTESQIDLYVSDNRGPGIQHMAFRVADLIKTVEYCNTQKIDFLPTPGAYYDLAPARIEARRMGPIREPMSELRRLSILLDGEEGGYLLQIFCKDQASQFGRPDAGPLFIELIQRNGSNGFGEGNFRALFESIERIQQGN